MTIHRLIIAFFCFVIVFTSGCQSQETITNNHSPRILLEWDIRPGLADLATYYEGIKDKRVGVVVNQTSVVDSLHTVDFLLANGVKVVKIFAPEHGFRGEADAGTRITDDVDEKTGLQVVSLYGSNRKPDSADLADLDVVLIDLQDVGVRFYTYISTMHLVMEACAANGVSVMVSDRPNPNGFYVDGPVLDTTFRSFVGMHAIPVVHGLTMGELALMIKGEGWISNAKLLNLEVLPCTGYTHSDTYDLPIKPSPNLPNLRSILLYPSLCLFEGTSVSIGRGTDRQFQVIGHPYYPDTSFSFIPTSRPGATNPKWQNERCYGTDLSSLSVDSLFANPGLKLDWFIDYHGQIESDFFGTNNFLEKLIGDKAFRLQMQDGWSAEQIRASWQKELTKYQEMRRQYLLYPDF